MRNYLLSINFNRNLTEDSVHVKLVLCNRPRAKSEMCPLTWTPRKLQCAVWLELFHAAGNVDSGVEKCWNNY